MIFMSPRCPLEALRDGDTARGRCFEPLSPLPEPREAPTASSVLVHRSRTPRRKARPGGGAGGGPGRGEAWRAPLPVTHRGHSFEHISQLGAWCLHSPGKPQRWCQSSTFWPVTRETELGGAVGPLPGPPSGSPATSTPSRPVPPAGAAPPLPHTSVCPRGCCPGLLGQSPHTGDQASALRCGQAGGQGGGSFLPHAALPAPGMQLPHCTVTRPLPWPLSVSLSLFF